MQRSTVSIPQSIWNDFQALALNQKDEAFQWLDKAFEERSPWLTYISVDPEFDNIRSDPRFKDLLRRIGLFT